MKKIHKAYKFELKPNKAEQILLNKHFGCARFVFNYFLNQRQEAISENSKIRQLLQASKIFDTIKKTKGNSLAQRSQ